MLKNMLFSSNSIWVLPWSFIVHVFHLLLKFFLRFSSEKSMENGSIFDEFSEKSEANSEGNDAEQMGCGKIEEIEDFELKSEVKSVCKASSTSKYQFIIGSSVCAYIEEPQTMNFTVKEMFVISHEQSSPREDSLEEDYSSPLDNFSSFPAHLDEQSLSHDLGIDSSHLEVDYSSALVDLDGKSYIDDLMLSSSPPREDFSAVFDDESFGHDFEDNSCNLEHNDCDELSGEEVSKEGETEISVLCLCYGQEEFLEKEENVDQKDDIMENIDFSEEVQSSISNSDDFWASIHKYDDFGLSCDYDEVLLYDKISAVALEPETPIGIGDLRVDYDQDSPRSIDDLLIDQINAQLDEVIKETEQERAESSPYIELVPQSYCSTNYKVKKHMFEDEFSDIEDNDIDQKTLKLNEEKDLDESENVEGDNEEDQLLGSDVLMVQKELIRQMKKEMRQLKISGLPTILEESESPRVEEDLRPLKIDERIRHKDRMDVIQTFYRRYLDKMRRLDILSQQTMYAIGLLQLKNQDLALNKKVSVPVIKSLLSQNFWSNKHKKHEADPVQKLIKDLQRDLELAYVGQLCLSWEMLKWQHNKTEELQAHDPDGFRHHNLVAGDFQKFQVLLQRFTEEEPFHQGPRVQHYVKSRCNLPALLQVPLIKDDPKNEWRKNGENGISVKMLKEVISSSMRAFWDFLHADKDEVYAIPLMGIHGVHQVTLQDPSDAELLAEIRSNLQKKEKRLKDLVRSGNCLVKKFQKHQDQRLSHEMLVAQVELRLVSRVLSMPRVTTDQLLWCHKKLNKIDIIGRKIYLEYSFLLFPC